MDLLAALRRLFDNGAANDPDEQHDRPNVTISIDVEEVTISSKDDADE